MARWHGVNLRWEETKKVDSCRSAAKTNQLVGFLG